MPTIVVAGANGRVGQKLVPKLKAAGHQVIALTRQADAPGADRVIKNWMQSAALAEVVRDADAIVNLTGEINPKTARGYDEANVSPAERLTAALGGRRSAQAVFISYPNANAASSNRFIAAKGKAEAIIKDMSDTACILRVSIIIGSPSQPTDFDTNMIVPAGKSARAFGDGLTKCRPVFIDDVVTAIANAVSNRTAGTFALQGPDEMTVDQIVRMLNRNPQVPISHTPGWVAKLLAPMIGIRPEMVDLFTADARDASADAMTALTLSATSLRQVWR